jgi:hypothetical protein
MLSRTAKANMNTILFLLCLFLLFSAKSVPAQDLLAEMKVDGTFGFLGVEVSVLGDFDGDAYQDLIVTGGSGVFVVAGADGEKLNHIPMGNKTLASIAGIGDVDGDGLPDIAAGNYDTVRAYSAVTGEMLWRYEDGQQGALGAVVVALGDVNGDGIPDVAAGDPTADPGGVTSAGILYVLDGATGEKIHIVEGTRFAQGVGLRFDAVGDLDGDGFKDLLIGDPMANEPSPSYGLVRAVSGADGDEIFTITADVPDHRFGTLVADAGDVNGDGVHDFVVGSLDPGVLALFSGAEPNEPPVWTKTLKLPDHVISVGDLNGDDVPDLAGARFDSYESRLLLIDGATGGTIDTLGSFDEGFHSIACPGDLTDDGKPDLFSALFESSVNEDPYAKAMKLPDGDTIFTVTNPPGGSYLGSAVAVAGDLDEDGLDDFIVASPTRFMVFAGDGSGPILDKIVSDDYPWSTADVMGFDDLTGDGIPELFHSSASWGPGSGSTGYGRVLILSGADGSIVSELQGEYSGQYFGGRIEPTIDRNGDGVRDFFVSLPGATVNSVTRAGEVRLLSGATGETLQVYHGMIQQDGIFGSSLSAEGDLDEDGVPDLGVGSSDKSIYPFEAGVFYILSGATGEELYRVEGMEGALYVRGDIIGDADGDGVADFITAEPHWWRPDDPWSGDRGRVQGWSGSDGSLLWQLEGEETSDWFGSAAEGVGDVNGDGYADVAISAFYGGTDDQGEFLLVSGRDGTVFDRSDLPSAATRFARIPYFDEGGCADVLVGLAYLNNDGGARIYASSQGGLQGFKDLGHALAGTPPAAPQLKGYGGLGVGELFSLKVRRVLPGAQGYWFFSPGAVELPFKGGVFVPDPYPYLFTVPVLANSEGEFTYSVSVPSGIPGGAGLVHQFWFHDPGAPLGASATNGLMEIFN